MLTPVLFAVFQGSPGPPGPPGPQGAPGPKVSPTSAMQTLLAALHVASVSQAKIRQVMLAVGLETTRGKGNAI